MPLIEQRIGQDGIEQHDKVQISIDRLQAHEPEEGYYVAFSGGKDSVVIYDLVEKSGVDFDAHYNVTTVDPPELVRFIKEKYPDVEFNQPDKSMWELIPEKLYPPTRLVRYCCEVLKERGGGGRFVVTGIRWEESASRKSRRFVERCSKNKDKVYVHPIIDWTESDVWDYIEKNGIDYSDLYDEGFDRLGCVGCPMTNQEQRKNELEKWPEFKKSYKRAFDRMLEVREERGKDTEWETAEEVMNWWLEGKASSSFRDDEEQQTMCFDN